MKKYIIFDLDGTLINSEEQGKEAIFRGLEEAHITYDKDALLYLFQQTAGTPLSEQLGLFFTELDETTLTELSQDLYAKIRAASDSMYFFDGIKEMLEILSTTYTLFLSTGNSDEFAEKMLKKEGVHHLFTKVQGSSYIGKSIEHIKIFKEYHDVDINEDFEKLSIFIGDGNTDREIAQTSGIDFIKIGKTGIDIHEVDKTIDILPVLENL